MVKINLLPIKSELRKKALIEHVALLSLCIVLVFILSWFVQASVNNQKEALQQEVTSTKLEIKRLTAEASEIEKFKQQKQELDRKLEIITNLNSKKSGPVEVLDQLSLLMPEKAWITSMKNTGNDLVLDGAAVDNPTVASFMKNLQASPYFQDVNLEVIQQQGSNHRFTIKCKIKLPS
ncbi:MAG: PilN domain-containing protein [Desulfomonilia bacterium]|jgi:type IV pilus assembly protein PilN